MQNIDWEALSRAAWHSRANAFTFKTAVGAALLDERGVIHSGCNIENSRRWSAVHAEVNAIGAMHVTGARKIIAILIAARRESFTPCGDCTDWVIEFGTPETFVAFQGAPGAEIKIYTVHNLMPHHNWETKRESAPVQ